jgi:hypothetical protein
MNEAKRFSLPWIVDPHSKTVVLSGMDEDDRRAEVADVPYEVHNGGKEIAEFIVKAANSYPERAALLRRSMEFLYKILGCEYFACDACKYQKDGVTCVINDIQDELGEETT